jgi:hypothetical protein
MCVPYVRDMTVLICTQERRMSEVHPLDTRGYVGIVAEPTGLAQSVISLCPTSKRG